MWFAFAMITFICWGTADLFYKKGADGSDRYSHLLTSAVVGIVMGLTAAATWLISGIHYDLRNLIIYLPVSAMYILSMTVGYFGLKYLELSVSSPVQNASGAVSCLLLILVLREVPDPVSLAAVVLISAGVIILGVLENKQNRAETPDSDRKYKRGMAAIFIPVIYCILDSLGTFFDGYYLDNVLTTPLVGVTEENLETVANVSYQLTFFIVAVGLLFYVRVICHTRIPLPKQGNRLAAAGFETAGQYAYVYAMAGNGVVAAPVIAAYCVASVILARCFLKEKLSRKQYFAVSLVMIGIVLLGIMEGLAE